MRKEFNDYDPKINYKKLISYSDEFQDNKDLYVDKHTRRLKANIDPKYFDDKDVHNAASNSNNNNEFNTDTRNDANQPKNENKEEEEEYTEENVNVETFDNMNATLNTNLNNKPKTTSWDQYVMYGSFYSLIVLIIILVIIYLKKTKTL